MTHSLLQRQLRKIMDKDGRIDQAELLRAVSLTYEEYDRTLRLQDNATQLMSDELNELNASIRRESDETIAASQKRFELAVEGTNDGLWDWNVHEDKLWFSSRAKTMLGYGAGQLQDSRIEDWYGLVNADDRGKAEALIRDYLDGHAPQPLTLRFDHASSGVRHIMCRVSAVQDSSHKVARLVGVHTDLTPLVIMTDELKRAKSMAEAANAAKSDFLANMSHELRTPLNSILGMTRLLIDTGLDSGQRELADTVFRSSVNLLDIVNDILDLSKIEANEMTLEQVGFDATDTFSNVLHALGHIASEKRVALRAVYDKEEFPYVKGDPLRLTRVLINLIGNAIKYTDKGHVEFRAACVPQADGYVELCCEIEDTGIGITPEKLDRVFEKFVQADTSATRRYGGTGLGLAITRELVELMDGEIGVRSALHKGSTFWFRIPFETTDQLAETKGGRSLTREQGAISAGEAHVLIAEDHPLNQAFVRKLMQRFGIVHFEVAETGAAALEKYRTRTWDIILMDCHMPEMNGYDVTREIRALEKAKGGHTPIVAMTANAMVGEREKCLHVGMDDYISKPINIDEMKDILGQWLRFEGDVSAPPSGAPVDPGSLREFSGGDREAEKELVALFIGQSDKNMNILAASRVGDDAKAWQEAAHMLKGGAAGIGARNLSALCEQAQHFKGPVSERRRLFDDMRAEYDRVRDHFRKSGLL
jgi:signal transduction histidine kinase/CheY-like chemotaxis protein/HPt (histidine-containing phosphotransfer) domain-containing protein